MRNSLLLFIISPFLGFFLAFKRNKEKWAKNSVWFFVAFFGYTMYRNEFSDSYRYVLNLEKLYKTNKSWANFTAALYSGDNNFVDIYQPLVTYLVSLFTNNGNVLFAIFGIVFGYFYSRNIWLLLDEFKGSKMNRSLWLLTFLFVTTIGFWELNGVRMWTAAHVFFYGSFIYLVNNNKRGLLFALASIFVHFSFVLPISLLFLFLFIRLPSRIFYYVYVFSFFITVFNFAAIRDLIESFTPDFLITKTSSYLDEDYNEIIINLTERTSWFVVLAPKLLNWFIFIMFTIIHFFKKGDFKSNKSLFPFFGFTLLLLTIGNILQIVPSGSRYLKIADLFAIAFIFLYYIKSNDLKLKKWVFYFRPVLVFILIVSVRISLDSISVMTVFGNPILVSVFDVSVPLLNLFK